jgi:flagellar biosynthetic protein FliO
MFQPATLRHEFASPVRRLLGTLCCLAATSLVSAAPAVAPAVQPPPESLAWSLFRVFGALALVLGLFLAGVWFFRNWQGLLVRKGRAPKLNVLEARSLGSRQAIYVVGYENQRFLIGSSPAGINLLTHLPPGTGTEADTAPPSFTDALQMALRGKQ